MTLTLTLEYWRDEDWYVGRLREVPGVFSQGGTLDELEENIRDAYSPGDPMATSGSSELTVLSRARISGAISTELIGRQHPRWRREQSLAAQCQLTIAHD